MKRYLAVEELQEGIFQLIFCAKNWKEAEEMCESWSSVMGTETQLCGEIT